MAIYVLVFGTSALAFKLADYVKKEQRIYIDAIAILFLCLLAGFRAESIGTDTRGYIQPMIKAAISADNIKDFFQYSWKQAFTRKTPLDFEIGYTIVIYMFSSLFKSVVVTQFVLELLVVLPVYIALRIKENVPIWFGMLVFMLHFFNLSLNLSRQSIGLSFVLLATTYWMKNNKKKCIMLLVVATLFHRSGLLGIAIVFFYDFVGREKNVGINVPGRTININYVNMLIVISAGIVALLGIEFVVIMLEKLKFSKYTWYILGDIHFMPNQIINIFPPFVLLLLSFKYFNSCRKEWAFYIVMIAYVMICGQFTSVNPYGGRIGLYFKIFTVFAYPLACKYSKYKGISSSMMISYLMFYWWFYYALIGSDQTVPYIMIQ